MGYIGDVNEEDASTNVILCMLGLPSQSMKVHQEVNFKTVGPSFYKLSIGSDPVKAVQVGK